MVITAKKLRVHLSFNHTRICYPLLPSAKNCLEGKLLATACASLELKWFRSCSPGLVPCGSQFITGFVSGTIQGNLWLWSIPCHLPVTSSWTSSALAKICTNDKVHPHLTPTSGWLEAPGKAKSSHRLREGCEKAPSPKKHRKEDAKPMEKMAWN